MELPRIPREPVVIEVTTQDLVDRTGLLFNGMVLDSAKQILHSGFSPAEALPLRLEHRLASRLTETPGSINRKAQKRQPAALMVLGVRSPTEIGLVGLFFCEREPELSQTRLEQSPHRFHVLGLPKEQTEIIRVADQFGLATK